MDFKVNINGLNSQNGWNNFQHKNKNVGKKVLENKEESNNLDKQDIHIQNKDLMDFQDSVTKTQDEINILEVAGETLDKISGNLNIIREMALETINNLDNFDLSEELKAKLDNIEKLESLQENFETIFDKNDLKFQTIIEEFKTVSSKTIKLAKVQGFEADLNSNSRIEKVLNEINETIDSVSSTKENLKQVKAGLVSNIKSLSIALENMASSYSKIRSIELASEAVSLAKEQILHSAYKSLCVQIKQPSESVNKLIN